MPTAKIAISIDPVDLKEVDTLVHRGVATSRSKLIQIAVHEKLARLKRLRLAQECAKLDRATEQAEADSFLVGEPAWPEY
jgi:metal-responsive CopG/Arc/MetJ family transcriptional regulator